MIAFPEMLVGPAIEAGMKVPESEDFDENEYPHFMVYLNMQIGSPMPSPTSHWTNAKIVAGIPESEIRRITAKQLKDLGFEIGHSN